VGCCKAHGFSVSVKTLYMRAVGAGDQTAKHSAPRATAAPGSVKSQWKYTQTVGLNEARSSSSLAPRCAFPQVAEMLTQRLSLSWPSACGDFFAASWIPNAFPSGAHFTVGIAHEWKHTCRYKYAKRQWRGPVWGFTSVCCRALCDRTNGRTCSCGPAANDNTDNSLVLRLRNRFGVWMFPHRSKQRRAHIQLVCVHQWFLNFCCRDPLRRKKNVRDAPPQQNCN